MALPPGPRKNPLTTARFLRNPVGLLTGLQRRYGDAFTLPFPLFGDLVYFAHPDAIKQVFRGDPKVFHSGEAVAPTLEPLVGTRSVFVLDEDEHLRERRLVLPPFHGERVRGYAETFAELAAREAAAWPVGEPFALRPRMQRLTLEAILRTVIGVTDPRRIELFHDRIERMGRGANLVLWSRWMRHGRSRLLPWGRWLHRRAATDELIHDEIDRARSDPRLDERDDILALLLAARHEDGSPMTREALRDELVTMIAAGHETTATALSWFFERVLRHPHVEERLRAEIEAGDDEYLDATAREVMRVRPTVVDVVRRVKEPVEIGGYELPAETHVVPAIALVQLREDVYPRAREFRPERWLETAADAPARPDSYTWIPFGGGVRRCIGASFAQLELKTMARAILERVRLEAPDPRDEPGRANNVTVVPGRGARVTVTERLAPASGVTTSQTAVTAA